MERKYTYVEGEHCNCTRSFQGGWKERNHKEAKYLCKSREQYAVQNHALQIFCDKLN
jgi:hypothetical protein